MKGIKMFSPNVESSVVSWIDNKAFKSYLKLNPIDATLNGSFSSEQNYERTYTSKELKDTQENMRIKNIRPSEIVNPEFPA